MLSEFAMSAKLPRSRFPVVNGSWKAFHDAGLKVAKGDEETIAEMDALDQIGDTVIQAIAAVLERVITAELSSA